MREGRGDCGVLTHQGTACRAQSGKDGGEWEEGNRKGEGYGRRGVREKGHGWRGMGGGMQRVKVCMD